MATAAAGFVDRALLLPLLAELPLARHAFAYGSGVFHQFRGSARQRAQPMLDILLAVDDAHAWHSEVRGQSGSIAWHAM